MRQPNATRVSASGAKRSLWWRVEDNADLAQTELASGSAGKIDAFTFGGMVMIAFVDQEIVNTFGW
jgi:hypothetical protein